ncbi:MAG: SGNH/GDSL hydrolase family protein [Pseudolabrys sp.]
MMGRVPYLLAALAVFAMANAMGNSVARADHLAECRLAEFQIERNFPLPQVARAIAAKKLNILVVGAGSSMLPGENGAAKAYPGRLQQALIEKLPGVEVKLTTDVKSKRSAAEMVKSMPPALAAKPALMIWQTGTVDALQQVEPDQFSQTLDKGINKARSAGADVIFMNPQYSPRTESMIALGTYAESMRWVALQQEMLVFDRFSIMKTWADLGTFDLYSATKKLDIAEQVHDCIGRLLADLILDAAKLSASHAEGAR